MRAAAPRQAPKRRRRDRRALGCAVWLALLAGCSVQDTPRRPDLLLVTVDTLRADALECYGGAADTGRELCALGDRGVRYEWAFSPAPSTAPAIASILTSRYPRDHGLTQFATTWLDRELLTLAEILAEAGYATAAFVSNPVLEPTRQLDQGFGVYDITLTRREPSRPHLAEREAEATTDAALGWLASQRPPRFLWVHFQDPHGPYDPPGADAPAPESGPTLPVLADHSGKRGIPSYQALRGVTSLGAYRERYRREIRYLDGHLARLLSAIPDAGVLLTSDHGEALGEDEYYLAHGHSVGLEQIRVPLLWHPPGGADPALVRAPVSTIDVAPTLLAAAGLDSPEAFQGHALPASEADASSARLLFAEHRARAAVLLGGRYYARDREDLGTGRPDRISGGVLEALPPRTARIGNGPALPAYEATAAGAAPDLEGALRSYLERPGAAPLEADDLPDETRERLRALGYLD